MCFLSVQSTQNSGATTAGSTSASSGSAGEGSSTAGGSTSGVGQSPTAVGSSAAATLPVGSAANAGGHLVSKAGVNFGTILLLLYCDCLHTYLYYFVGIHFPIMLTRFA